MKIKELRLNHLIIPSNVFMAPMAAYTCYPFRILCQQLGAGLSFTEMVSCNALKYKDQANRRLLFTTTAETIKAAQLLGGDPAVMEQAACSEYLSPFDIIDINMGCPVPNVIKSGEGSALMTDPRRAAAIIRGCRKSGKIVTVKCRVGMTPDHLIAAEFAKMCEDAGAALISIHGRTRSMMYSGTPFYDQIAQAKSAVSIPVIANGGITTAADADLMMDRTGADGVMLARGAFEDPLLFSTLTGQPVTRDKYQIIMDQIALTAAHYDETFTIQYIRRIAAYCMKKRPGTKRYKQLLYQCGSLDDLKQITKKIFSNQEDPDIP